jgi:hypothetical protein
VPSAATPIGIVWAPAPLLPRSAAPLSGWAPPLLPSAALRASLPAPLGSIGGSESVDDAIANQKWSARVPTPRNFHFFSNPESSVY